MTTTLETQQTGAALEVIFAPPFGMATRAAGRAALGGVLDALPPDVTCVVLRSGARPFVCGPDPGAIAQDPAPQKGVPDLASLCHRLETCPLPVIFVIEGRVAGDMAELALAAHHRIAAPQGQIAFGMHRLGLISGAGGTQRLAALLGAEQALRILRSGAPVAAPEAVALGLIDRVVDGTDRAALHRAARDVALPLAPRPFPGLRDAPGFLAAVATARQTARTPADTALVACIEAAILLPREQALGFEAAIARDLATSAEAAALCHIYRAERQAARLAGPQATGLRHLGLAGADLALVALVGQALARGVCVTVAEGDRDTLIAFLQSVAARQEASVQAGQTTGAQRDAAWGRLVPAGEVAALAGCDMVIGAQAAQVPGADTAQIALITGRGAVPAEAYRLRLSGRVAELGLPAGARVAGVARVLAALRQLGQIALPTDASCPRGVARRLLGAADAAMAALAASGAAQADLTAAMDRYGLMPPPLTAPEDRPPRALPQDQIARRVLAAMANEGACILGEGIVATAHQIDLVAVHGLGFARAQGGPMHQAERRGLLVLRRDLTDWAAENALWQPVAALDTYVSAGRFPAAPV